MTNFQKPLFVIAIHDKWAALEMGPELFASPAFGIKEDAMKYARHMAERDGLPVALYRIVTYVATGEVCEGDERSET